MADRQEYTYPYPPSIPPYEPPPPPFEPNEEQLARVQQLRRFNFWAVYFPLGLVGLVVLGLVVYMLVLAIWPPYEGTRPFLSGLADSVLIMSLLPLVLVCGLLQAAMLGGFYYWRQSRKEAIEADPSRQYGRLRLFLWRLQQWLDLGMEKLTPVLDGIAAQVIRLNAIITEWVTRWQRLRRGRQ